MIKIHFLTPGYEAPNSRGLLIPLHRYQHKLSTRGIQIRIFQNVTEAVYECDLICVDSKFFRHDWSSDQQKIFKQLSTFQEHAERVYWFDTTDSTGTLQSEVLPYVDRYLKNQLLNDRKKYLSPFYGGRIYTEYYHDEMGIEDEEPYQFTRVDRESDLEKIQISWNSALGDYSPNARNVNSVFRKLNWILFDRFPWTRYLHHLCTWHKPEKKRPNHLITRFGTTYGRNTVEFHRKTVRDILEPYSDFSWIPRAEYWREMINSKIVVSPFGMGEICYRDYECFISGSILLKPSMDHLETWPPLYDAFETYVPFHWDFKNVKERIHQILSNPDTYRNVARKAQSRYRRYLNGPESGQLFVNRFLDVIS